MRLPRRVFTAVAAGIVLALAGATAAQADQVRGMEYWLSDYGVSRAWATTRGAGVTIAVIDTGIDSSVPELAGAVIGGTDVSGIGAGNGQKPLGGTESGHGTWVASLLAGRGTGGGNGVIGVAPAASILSISVALGEENAPVSSDDQIANGVRWAVDHGASVINMSLTRNTLDWPVSWDSAFQYAADHNVVIVAAAGNRGSGTSEVGAPATIPGVLTVAGVDRSGKASFDASSQGITIAVAAPSEQLVGADPGGGYVQWSGTSGAAPLVAGIVALVRAAHPGLDAANVINRVVKTARAVGAVPSPIYGNGLVDAAAAVTAEVAPVTANPMGDLKEWVRIHRRAEPATGATSVPIIPPAATTPKALPPDRSVNMAEFLAPQWDVATSFGVPFALFVGFGALVGLGIAGARLHFRRASRRG
ncbi:MAG: hypothetical protein QOF36_2291 [Microbacteriaceae bacterium]|jgi:type VII secretion-associated serine protease mycosin|nr:hypothetical protein [Microbacteriaceae bacterium]